MLNILAFVLALIALIYCSPAIVRGIAATVRWVRSWFSDKPTS